MTDVPRDDEPRNEPSTGPGGPDPALPEADSVLPESDPALPESDSAGDALTAALMEIERHVSRLGWDQPARLFALVRTADLVRAEPHLAEPLDAEHRPADAFSSIEQDTWNGGEDVADALGRIMWPETVEGAAIALERAFLPAHAEADLPEDPDAAAQYVAHHPQREDIRLVAGVLRGGEQQSLARLASTPEEILAGAEMAPGLSELLRATLE